MTLAMPPRLAGVLQSNFDDLTEDHLRRLVGLREDEDLDFKQELYGRRDQDSQELASDLASFANTRGGLLCIGMAEEAGLATQLAPISLPDTEEDLRLHQIAAALVFPRPEVRVRLIPSEIEGRGYLAVTIPLSPMRPHAVRSGDRLRYIVRSGPGKRALSESEVADYYRRRFLVTEERLGRLHGLHEEGLSHLDRSDRPWLVMSLVPDAAGSMQLRAGLPRQLKEWAEEVGRRSPQPSWFNEISLRATARMHGVTITDDLTRSSASSWFHSELYMDGSAFGAGVIGWRRERERLDLPISGEENETQLIQIVDDERLALGVASLLHVLASHAVENSGTWGMATVQAELVSSSDESEMVLFQFRSDFSAPIHGTRFLRETGRTSRTVDLEECATPTSALLIAARWIAGDLVAAFGLPDLYQFSEAGELRKRYFMRDKWTQLQPWAQERGIPVTEEAVAQS